jgi:hypothetical protein
VEERNPATSRSATRNRSRPRSDDLGPSPIRLARRQLACICGHAYMDTEEEPTMTQPSSKIERPLPRSP